MYFQSEGAGGGENPLALIMKLAMRAILMTKNSAAGLYSAIYLTPIFGNSVRQRDTLGYR